MTLLRNFILFASAFLSINGAAIAQATRVLHQTFEFPDEVSSIESTIAKDSVEIVTWQGINILTETTILLEQASKAIMDNAVEEGRYKLSATASDGTLVINFEQPGRRELRVRGATCYEKVSVRIYIPDTFEPNGDQKWRKK